MSAKPEGRGAMLSIAETVTLMADGMDEIRVMIFRRKKQREKQRN